MTSLDIALRIFARRQPQSDCAYLIWFLICLCVAVGIIPARLIDFSSKLSHLIHMIDPTHLNSLAQFCDFPFQLLLSASCVAMSSYWNRGSSWQHSQDQWHNSWTSPSDPGNSWNQSGGPQEVAHPAVDIPSSWQPTSTHFDETPVYGHRFFQSNPANCLVKKTRPVRD